MKILFVHEVSWHKKVVYEIHDFPELLALRGHDVSFLEYDEDKGKIEHEGWNLQRKILSSVSLNSRAHPGSEARVKTPRRFLPGIFGRLLAVVLHPYVIYKELKNNRPDVIVLYAIPTNGWQTTLLAKRMKIPVIFRAIDISHQIRKTLFSPIIVLAEKIVYRNATHISTHNYAMKEYLASYGCELDRISVLLPGVDLERFSPQDPSPKLQQRLGIGASEQVIIFMGTIFRFAGVVDFIEEASEFLRKKPSIKFLILGDGEDFGRVKQSVEELGLSNQVVTPGRISYDELAGHLCLGSVAILPFLKESVTDFALPGKVAQYLSCGLPTVSIKLKGLESVIPEGCGITYQPDIKQLTKTTLNLLGDLKAREDFGIKGRQFTLEHCNWISIIKEFEQLLLDQISPPEN